MQRLREELHGPAVVGGVAGTQPGMQHQHGLAEEGDQRPVRPPAAPRRVVAVLRAFLMAEALEQGRVEIKQAAARRMLGQQPPEQGREERRVLGRTEPQEEVAHRVIPRETRAAEGLQRPVRAQHLQVREAPGAGHHAQPERQQRVRRIDGVVRPVAKRQPGAHGLHCSQLAQQLHHHHQPPKGCYGPLRLP